MVEFKQLAENILDDLMGKTPVSDILLKTKIFATKKNDQDLLKWVCQELEGYNDTPPQYRIINAGLKVDVFIPFRGTVKIKFPTEVISQKEIGEMLSRMPIRNSISEIESLCSNADGSQILQMHVPVFVYDFLKPFLNGDIQDSYQYVSKAAVYQIVVTVKSLLIDFLLKISNEEDLDFNSFIKSKSVMITNNHITAGIVNIGDGSIHTNDTTTIIGDNNSINDEQKRRIESIINEIDSLADGLTDRNDYDGVSSDIKNELKKEKPQKSFLKRCFQAIPTILGSLSSDIIANQLQPYISSALQLLA